MIDFYGSSKILRISARHRCREAPWTFQVRAQSKLTLLLLASIINTPLFTIPAALPDRVRSGVGIASED